MVAQAAGLALPDAGVKAQHAGRFGQEVRVPGEQSTTVAPGRRASSLSHRQIVVPLIPATSPCWITSRCNSRTDQRDSGTLGWWAVHMPAP